MAQNIDLSQFDLSALLQGHAENSGGYQATLSRYASALTTLRQALEKGDVSVSEYLQVARPIAEDAQHKAYILASSGSTGANMYKETGIEQAMQQAGFSRTSELGKASVNLGQKFETQLREELIPENIVGDERARLLNEIPLDIGFDTDRFAVEREGIRQRLQTERDAADAKTRRGQALDELAGLLSKQADEAFDTNRAGILEDLNSRGLLTSSAVGSEFAKERARQKTVSENIISAQSISDRDADINALLQAGAGQRGFQSAGLQREFGLEDLTRSQNFAAMLAEISKPEQKGKTGGERAFQAAQGTASVVGMLK